MRAVVRRPNQNAYPCKGCREQASGSVRFATVGRRNDLAAEVDALVFRALQRPDVVREPDDATLPTGRRPCASNSRVDEPLTTQAMSKHEPEMYTLIQAAAHCGYRRANTMRELHLATDAQRTALGHRYDEAGRVILSAAAVNKLARRLSDERRARGNWRLRNLGSYAEPGRRRQLAASDAAPPVKRVQKAKLVEAPRK